MAMAGGQVRWSSKHRNALTPLFQKYHEDSAEGVSYETVDIENKDYVDSVYRGHAIFQETVKKYFKNHFIDCANKFRLELQERGARRPPANNDDDSVSISSSSSSFVEVAKEEPPKKASSRKKKTKKQSRPTLLSPSKNRNFA